MIINGRMQLNPLSFSECADYPAPVLYMHIRSCFSVHRLFGMCGLSAFIVIYVHQIPFFRTPSFLNVRIIRFLMLYTHIRSRFSVHDFSKCADFPVIMLFTHIRSCFSVHRLFGMYGLSGSGVISVHQILFFRTPKCKKV